MSTVKVRVILSLEVDREAWDAIYGSEGLADLREQVRNYVLHNTQDSAAAEDGAIVSVRPER